ncbi:flagellar hook-length control protein FliK [Anaeromicropila herbilytica]|uniref:Flagellar hook-length control protein-like C-terminal domain-containing protein n=1 Tax=Anaeromicropila herbilytica TaxID=2785025 RepID=A0A7R7EMC6_9FIRM|nr:flagellar hook-length control protein FliK [Anaeromicropila herbilytica]BCN31530.1 hypothetical protein bsdtb5_28250 [Anaeromicropila herbilytica]
MVNNTVQSNQVLGNLFSNQSTAKDSSTKASTSKTADFGTLMTKNLGSRSKDVTYDKNVTSNDKAKVTNNSQKDSYKDTYKDKVSHDDDERKSISDKDSYDTKTVNDSKEDQDVSTAETRTSNDSSQKVDDKIKNPLESKMSKLENDIKDIVKDALNLSDEQLENLMSQLGLGAFDLLKLDNLKALTLAANNETDVTSILTNQNIGEQWNQLVSGIENIDLEADYGITEDQINKLVEEMKNQTSNDVQSLDTKVEKKTTDGKQNDQQEVVIGPEEKQVKIEVVKDTESNSNHTSDTAVTAENKESSSMGQPSQSGQQDAKNNTASTNENPLDILVNNLSGNVNQVNSFSEQVSKVTQMREIVNQIVEQIKINIKPDTTSMEMILNPENLGKVNLMVSQKNGIMTAQFLVENQATKEAIESQINILKENLENQGLKVEAVEVAVSNFGFNQNNESATGNGDSKSSSKKKINIDDYMDGDDTSAEETGEDNLLNDGGSINYIA